MLLLALLLAAAQPAKVAAVLELRNKLEGADRNVVDAGFLTDVVRQQVLENAPNLKLMTRENVLTLLEASGKKLEECEGECEVETGRRLGADVVITGEILRFGKGLRANLRLHDTHSAQLLAAAVASGETPEALEKDLARAVSKLVVPVREGYQPEAAKSPEWYETIGFYVTGGIGSMSAENFTPRALAPPAGTLTFSNLKQDAVNLGLGVQYQPWRWLVIDVHYLFNSLDAQVSSVMSDGHTEQPKTLQSPALGGSASGLWRISRIFRVFGGFGLEYFFAKIGPDNRPLDNGSAVNLAVQGGAGTYSNNAGFTRPLLRGGLELKPQERFGIQVYGVWYPVAHDIDVYAHNVQNPQGTDTPVLKYTPPVATVNASLALYF